MKWGLESALGNARKKLPEREALEKKRPVRENLLGKCTPTPTSGL